MVTVNIRHIIKKTFDGEVEIRSSMVYFGLPINIPLRGDVSDNVIEGLKSIGIEQKSYKDLSFSKQESRDTAKNMFSNTNPKTNRSDLSGDEFYIDSILKAVVGGIITPQTTEYGYQIFNGEGTITIAEVLDAINAVDKGANSEDERHLSLDNISDVEDYFNEGYNICCWGYSSPFYNLYTREELVRPITRIELAYILVVCTQIYDLFRLSEGVGITFNWLKPMNYISSFTDFDDLNVGLILTDDAPEINIKKYLNGRSVTGMLNDIKVGRTAIPMPMLMSLVELGVQDYFYFDGDELAPLRQVSRGELCYLFDKMQVNLRKVG